MFKIILIFLLIFACLYITYFIIKIAVKHAIKESLDDIQLIIKEAVSQNITEYEWKNKNSKP